MLDRKPKMSARQAVEAATRGELVGPNGKLPPFGKDRNPDGSWNPMPLATAHDYARREKQNRTVVANGRLAKAPDSSHAVRMVLAEAWNELDRARKAARSAKYKPAERAKAQREFVRTALDIHRAEAELQGKPSGNQLPPQAPSTEKPKRTTEETELVREAKARARAEHHDTTTDQGPATPLPAPTHDAREEEREDGFSGERAQTRSVERNVGEERAMIERAPGRNGFGIAGSV